jgi:drug/metabolite transporter (DMT)-like permease
MTPRRILGVTLFSVGCLLLAAGYHASGAPMEQLSNSLTGRYTDQTIWFLIAGIASAIGGALLVMRVGRTDA